MLCGLGKMDNLSFDPDAFGTGQFKRYNERVLGHYGK